jgi:hypothetical protein
MEPDLELVECFSGANRCVITGACRLQHVLAGALNAARPAAPARRTPRERSSPAAGPSAAAMQAGYGSGSSFDWPARPVGGVIGPSPALTRIPP